MGHPIREFVPGRGAPLGLERFPLELSRKDSQRVTNGAVFDGRAVTCGFCELDALVPAYEHPAASK